MSEERQALAIRRILVALDASPHSRAALDAAVELAARLHAELAALFVEDEALLRLADLPFVQEVGLFSATRRRLERGELERAIRARGREARRILAVATQRTEVTWSFRSVRGTVLSEVLSAASEADVLVLGKLGWSSIHRKRLGSTVRGILPERFGLALVLEEGACFGFPLAVVYDGSPAAGRALLTATALRRRAGDDQALIVLLLAHGSDEAELLQEQAGSVLEDREAPVRYRLLTGANVMVLADALQSEGCATLVLPAQGVALQSNVLETLLEKIDLPVLLVT
ncbi:MAG: universal stress protein [Anaerolineae bacterium]